jgi:hypothetical protein
MIQEPEYSELDAARDQISELQDMLAVANLHSTNTEEQAQAASNIAFYVKENKSLLAQLDAVTKSRDAYITENASMKRVMAAQRRELDQLKNQA